MGKYAMTSVTCMIILIMSCNLNLNAQQDTQTRQRERGAVVYDLPGTDDVIIKKDIPYTDIAGSPMKMDIYYPPDFDFRRSIPAVVMVLGYPDAAGKKLIGSEFRNFTSFISWCKIISASGMAAIVYESADPEKDIISLSEYLKANAGSLQIDNSKIGAFTLSGHSPTAVAYVLNNPGNMFKCAVVYYGLFLTRDFKYLVQIDSISQKMGFKTPRLSEPAGWKKNIPIMIVRAGRDNAPYLNESIACFYEKALTQNLPVTLINNSDGVHGFDIYDDNETSRQIIINTIEFLKFNLKQ